jgi:hypothetical protein
VYPHPVSERLCFLASGVPVKVKIELSLYRPRKPLSVERSRLPHFLDNRLTDGGNVVSLTRRPPLTPQ